jgi:zinc/manganese transport system substrate-binding protein
MSRAKPRIATSMLITALLLAAAGCGGGTDSAADTPTIVATTTILGDIVGHIAGTAATVDVLMPVGVDPHEYQASAQQVASLERADLAVANGLLLEEGLGDALSAATDDGANVLSIGPLVDPISFGSHPSETTGTMAAATTADPHVWLDPIRMADAATIIGEKLEELYPGGGWTDRAAAYSAELVALDSEIRATFASIPESDRILVTNHQAFGYFADRYGFRIIGSVIPGGSTLAEPSSAELAALVDVIRTTGVPAIFVETAEVGADVQVVALYTGSLGEPDSGADTLIGMLRTDAARIAAALDPNGASDG